MKEEQALYEVVNSIPVVLGAFENRACALPKANENYRAPEPEEVKALISLCGWSQGVTAKITGVSYSSKGSTSVRRWQYPKENPNYRSIDYSTWRLMLISAGVVNQEDALKEIGLNGYALK